MIFSPDESRLPLANEGEKGSLFAIRAKGFEGIMIDVVCLGSKVEKFREDVIEEGDIMSD